MHQLSGSQARGTDNGSNLTRSLVVLRDRYGSELEALWHAGLDASVSNGAFTYELDGNQYVIVGAGDTLWAFVMNERQPAKR